MNAEGRYKDKILGVRNYTHEQGEFLVSDFIELDLLEPIIDEFITSESDITPAGKAFLKEYYGLETLSKTLFNRDKLKEPYPKPKTPEGLLEILQELEPMQAITFIEKSRGNISDDSELSEKLLPPE